METEMLIGAAFIKGEEQEKTSSTRAAPKPS